MFRIKYEEAFSYKPNADTSHLLDSLVSALAVYATAFRSRLSLVCACVCCKLLAARITFHVCVCVATLNTVASRVLQDAKERELPLSLG